jgi:hypothetical protein
MIQLKRTQRSIPKSYMEMFPLFIDDIRRDMRRATMILSSNPVLELALHRENRGPTGNQKESGGNGLGLGILDVGAETHTLMGVGPTRCWGWERALANPQEWFLDQIRRNSLPLRAWSCPWRPATRGTEDTVLCRLK